MYTHTHTCTHASAHTYTHHTHTPHTHHTPHTPHTTHHTPHTTHHTPHTTHTHTTPHTHHTHTHHTRTLACTLARTHAPTHPPPTHSSRLKSDKFSFLTRKCPSLPQLKPKSTWPGRQITDENLTSAWLVPGYLDPLDSCIQCTQPHTTVARTELVQGDIFLASTGLLRRTQSFWKEGLGKYPSVFSCTHMIAIYNLFPVFFIFWAKGQMDFWHNSMYAVHRVLLALRSKKLLGIYL